MACPAFFLQKLPAAFWPRGVLFNRMSRNSLRIKRETMSNLIIPAEMAVTEASVLSVVNAPYKQAVTALMLARCLSRGSLGAWPAHIATFFTEVDAELVFAFAERHGIPTQKLGEAYAAMKAKTGESNPEIESALEPASLSA
jgi:hypothetical protein